jgi:mono/diheme cytochrome c family protein
MRFLVLIFSAALLSATLAQAQSSAAKQMSAPAGDPQKGRSLFEKYGCYQCHGHEAQGGSAGARLAPRPISYAAFSKYVRQPLNQMPPYTAKVLPDRELADIYAFLSSIPQPPAAKDIPLLNR